MNKAKMVYFFDGEGTEATEEEESTEGEAPVAVATDGEGEASTEGEAPAEGGEQAA
jgi:hypothetical protein